MLGIGVLLGILTLAGQPFEITLWDWLDLLIMPVVLAIGEYLFTRSESRRAERSEIAQRNFVSRSGSFSLSLSGTTSYGDSQTVAIRLFATQSCRADPAFGPH